MWFCDFPESCLHWELWLCCPFLVLPARVFSPWSIPPGQSEQVFSWQEQNDGPEWAVWGLTHAELSEALVLTLCLMRPGPNSICCLLGAIPSWLCLCPYSAISGSNRGTENTRPLLQALKVSKPPPWWLFLSCSRDISKQTLPSEPCLHEETQLCPDPFHPCGFDPAQSMRLLW